MRKLSLFIAIMVVLFFITACQIKEEKNIVVPLSSSAKKEIAPTCSPLPTPYCHGNYDEIGSFCVYIQKFSAEDDCIVVRPIEWITPRDEKRIEELGLDMERDLICGYYIKDWGFSEMKIPITEDTEYHFIDYGHDYLELERQGLCTITKEEEIFIGYWEKYGSMMTKYPFFVELNEDGTLKLISEKMIP